MHVLISANRKLDRTEPGEWVPVLSHLMESCPNLKQLYVLFDFEPSPEEVPSRRWPSSRVDVLPHLPQESKAVVNVVFWLHMGTRRFEVSPF